VWIHGAVKKSALLAHTVTGWLAARDVRLVPGREIAWHPPISEGEFLPWIQMVEDRIGRSIHSWVVHLPADRRRRRFNLLFLNLAREPVAFAKVTANSPNPLAIRALAEFASSPPDRFWAPALLIEGRLADFSYVVTTPMPNVAHRPAELDIDARHGIVAEFQAKLRHLVHGPLVLVHGDFGPWNVRRLLDGRVAVVDWEEATPGVPLADELWHSVSVQPQRMGNDGATGQVYKELSHYSTHDVVVAAKFWLDRLARPQPEEIDESIPMPARLDIASTRIEQVLRTLAG
jgi:hypothetical protein